MASEPATDTHEAGGATVNLDPMHQFDIYSLVPIDIGGVDASFTNSSLWMLIAAGSVVVLLLSAPSKLVPTRLQSIGEVAYEFIANMMRDILGESGRPFFPFVFTLFMFILAGNMMGMVPYSFTVTSHIIVTFALAAVVFVGATVVGFVKNGPGYLRLFVPSGVPVLLLPLLVVIELISYFTRPISLSVRLFANMMAGHTMLKVFAGFVVMFGVAGAAWLPLGLAPFLLMIALTGLEILIAFLQAYVFAVLTCIYLNDALNMHH